MVKVKRPHPPRHHIELAPVDRPSLSDEAQALFVRLAQRSTMDKAEGCWTWLGALDSKGYGKFNYGGTTKSVHRTAYRLLGPPFDEQLTLDHLCRNRACWRPSHLEPVTLAENLLRSPLTRNAINALRVTCPAGHSYNESNTYVRRRANGRTERECRECRRIRTNNREVAS